MVRVEHGANSAWPFGPERFTAVPTGIGGCSPAILIPIGCSSGMSPIFPQVDRSPTLRSEPFSSRLATDQRNKNSCATILAGEPVGLFHPFQVDDVVQRRQRHTSFRSCQFSYPLSLRGQVCEAQGP